MGSSLWLAILSAPQAHPCSTVSDFGPCFCCVAQSLTQPWQPLHPLTGPRASTSSNLSLQMCFSSLGDLKREEYPNEEIYWTCKYLANCARRPQSVRLKVTLKPQDAFSLLLTIGCTIGVAQKYFRVLVCLFSLFNWKKKKKKLLWRTSFTFVSHGKQWERNVIITSVMETRCSMYKRALEKLGQRCVFCLLEVEGWVLFSLQA